MIYSHFFRAVYLRYKIVQHAAIFKRHSSHFPNFWDVLLNALVVSSNHLPIYYKSANQYADALVSAYWQPNHGSSILVRHQTIHTGKISQYTGSTPSQMCQNGRLLATVLCGILPLLAYWQAVSMGQYATLSCSLMCSDNILHKQKT